MQPQKPETLPLVCLFGYNNREDLEIVENKSEAKNCQVPDAPPKIVLDPGKQANNPDQPQHPHVMTRTNKILVYINLYIHTYIRSCAENAFKSDKIYWIIKEGI